MPAGKFQAGPRGPSADLYGRRVKIPPPEGPGRTSADDAFGRRMRPAAVRSRTGGQDRMNGQLKREHYQRITEPKARRMYNRLCDACEKRPEGMTDADQMLIADVAMAEQIKQALMDDIAGRGIGETRRNGRQVYWAENKSLAQLRAFSEQQRKHLAELKLTPCRRQTVAVEIDDEFESFPD